MSFNAESEVGFLNSAENALTGRSTPAELIAQRGLFSGPTAVVAEEMCSVIQHGVVRRSRFEVVLAPESRYARVCYRLFREGPDVGRRYREAMPELASRENWARLFGRS